MPDSDFCLIVAATFLLAGFVKGVIGLGLPTISLALLTAASDLTTAMALLIFPSFLTNLWQAVTGGRLREIVARTWPFLATASLTIPLGTLVLGIARPDLLAGLLGVLIVAYALSSLAGFSLEIDANRADRAGLVLGSVNGLLTGMTGSFVVPGVMYLQALGLPRDQLVQAMGVLFTLSTLILGVALGWAGLVGREQAALSAFGVLPALAGMIAGQRLRRWLSEAVFRRVFFVSLVVLGCYIAASAAQRLA